jgi:hypothetical protein
MRISRSLCHKDQTIRLLITDHGRGWEVRQQQDSETVSDVVYNDWHRVERALAAFDRRAATLRHKGWTDNGASAPHTRDAA